MRSFITNWRVSCLLGYVALAMVVAADQPAGNPSLAAWAGKSVVIHYDLDLNQDGVASKKETDYLIELLQEAGARVKTYGSPAAKDSLLIIGKVAPLTTLAPGEMNGAWMLQRDKAQQERLSKYDQTVADEKSKAAKVSVRVIMADEVPSFFHIDRPSDAQLRSVLAASQRRSLRRAIPEVKFDGNSLSDVVDFLRDVSGLELRLDRATLEKAGVDTATPVSLRVLDCPFFIVADLVVDQADANKVELISDGESILLTTRAEAKRRIVAEPTWRSWRDLLADPTPVLSEPASVLREQLGHQIEAIKFQGNSLPDCLDFLRDVSRVNIYVNSRDLIAAKIDPNAAVSVMLDKPSFSKAVTAVVHAVSPDDKLVAYSDRGYVVRLTTADKAHEAIKMDKRSFLLMGDKP